MQSPRKMKFTSAALSSCRGGLLAVFPFLIYSTAIAADEARIAEARVRSQLLHETIHGSLQVMHRDFFREEERLRIPSESLEGVFKELEKTWQVKVRWLAVNAKPMNIDHKPADAFERKAASKIGSGEEMYETTEGETYRYAGAITLGNECLKCHVPDRTSLEDRKAALLITMPLRIVNPD
jgi:hypothetical protein